MVRPLTLNPEPRTFEPRTFEPWTFEPWTLNCEPLPVFYTYLIKDQVLTKIIYASSFELMAIQEVHGVKNLAKVGVE